MNEWELTDDDFIQLFTEEQRAQGVPDKYNFPEAIAGNVHYHRVLAKAQAKKLVEWITLHSWNSDKEGYILVNKQALRKEVGLE